MDWPPEISASFRAAASPQKPDQAPVSLQLAESCALAGAFGWAAAAGTGHLRHARSQTLRRPPRRWPSGPSARQPPRPMTGCRQAADAAGYRRFPRGHRHCWSPSWGLWWDPPDAPRPPVSQQPPAASDRSPGHDAPAAAAGAHSPALTCPCRCWVRPPRVASAACACMHTPSSSWSPHDITSLTKHHVQVATWLTAIHGGGILKEWRHSAKDLQAFQGLFQVGPSSRSLQPACAASQSATTHHPMGRPVFSPTWRRLLCCGSWRGGVACGAHQGLLLRPDQALAISSCPASWALALGCPRFHLAAAATR